jgi:hypothetical protein
MSRIPAAAIGCAMAALLSSCGGSSPTQPAPAPSPSPTPAAQPSPSPSGPSSTGCTFAPGPVTRLAIAPRALQTNGVSAPMRTRLVGPGEEVLCLAYEKSHRLDFNLNQRNALGQESCWEGFPSYRIRGDTEHMVTGTSPIDDNGFIFRVRVEPREQEASFGVEAVYLGNGGYEGGSCLR